MIYPDRDNMVSNDLKVIVPHASKNKSYSLPKIDSQVVCLLLQTGQEEGFVIGSTYNETDVVPVSNEDVHMIKFEDGTKIEYNESTTTLKIEAARPIQIVGDIEITGEIRKVGG